ncbi:hypothetical protein PVAP13_6KG158712 [Panicum virgatum]|uniref:Uncharacterized protein n=1 Tax=Panicum virgatum TaxID=38727 RepID=A0A8T0RAA9_PANVG|nr:hypothetical protein PVAP13_6KG158712 [Panicum virgatum]
MSTICGTGKSLHFLEQSDAVGRLVGRHRGPLQRRWQGSKGRLLPRMFFTEFR